MYKIPSGMNDSVVIKVCEGNECGCRCGRRTKGKLDRVRAEETETETELQSDT